jgi:protein CpxP
MAMAANERKGFEMVRAILRTGGLVVAAGLLSLLIVLPGGDALAQAQPGAQPPSIDSQIAQLRQRLRLTPAQQPEFNALAATMREMPNAPPPSGKMTAVQSVQAQIQMTQQALGGMQRMLQALEPLYAKLSPQQRRVADEFFGPEAPPAR